MNTPHDEHDGLAEEPARYNAEPQRPKKHIHFRKDEDVERLRNQLFSHFDPKTTNFSGLEREVYMDGVRLRLAKIAAEKKQKRAPKKRP